MEQKVEIANWKNRLGSVNFFCLYDVEYHAWVRHTVVAYMSNLKRRYQRFFPNSEVFAQVRISFKESIFNLHCGYFRYALSGFQYLLEMSRNATWGDHLTLCAIADAFRCAFHLITSNEKTWCV